MNTAQSESLDFSKRATGGRGEDVDRAKFFVFCSFRLGGEESDEEEEDADEDETRWTTDD